MADDDSGRPQLLRAAISLGKSSRWAAFVLGLAGLGAGGTAVFITHLEAGPVALIAAGLVLMPAALAGKMPTRLKWGENEAEFLEERLSDALREGVESADPDARAEVGRFVANVAEVAPEVAFQAQAALVYNSYAIFLHVSAFASNFVISNLLCLPGRASKCTPPAN